MVLLDVSTELIARAREFAEGLLRDHLPAGFTYHTFEHTEQVVAAVTEIGQKSGLNPAQVRLLQLVAWLHDLGYVRKYMGHEEASIELGREFLAKENADPELVREVEVLIHATKLDHAPVNLMEMVLKDADLYNLALPEALENSQRIREEWAVFCNQHYTDEEWDQFNYRFFKQHAYFTDYGKSVLGPMKRKSAKRLKRIIRKRELVADLSVKVQNIREDAQDQQTVELQKLRKAIKDIKKDRPDRGIETMFRITYRTHINLSSIADNKANILLSINAIIISIVFTAIFRDQVDTRALVIFPVFAMLVVCMATIVFAILATRPKINSGVFTRDDIINKRTNLLFFGNFYRMDLDDYMWGIQEMMEDAEYLYGSMAKDLYFLGKVLAKKFYLLRIAYNIFMYGMALAIVATGVILIIIN
jgi:predicted metal-dependent HD superfamily phosphohydrolase